MNRSQHRIGEETRLEHIRFAKEHELAWLLRWALAQVVRLKEGTKEMLRGMMEWEVYEEWRGRERGEIPTGKGLICPSTDCMSESRQLPHRCLPLPLRIAPIRGLRSHPCSTLAPPFSLCRLFAPLRSHATCSVFPFRSLTV